MKRLGPLSLGRFPDTADALRILKVTSNWSFCRTSRRICSLQPKLGVEFDAIYTAQDVGSYKPAPGNFEYMLEHLKKDLARPRLGPAHGPEPPSRPPASKEFWTGQRMDRPPAFVPGR